jgi:hypothetical protein
MHRTEGDRRRACQAVDEAEVFSGESPKWRRVVQKLEPPERLVMSQVSMNPAGVALRTGAATSPASRLALTMAPRARPLVQCLALRT